MNDKIEQVKEQVNRMKRQARANQELPGLSFLLGNMVDVMETQQQQIDSLRLTVQTQSRDITSMKAAGDSDLGDLMDKDWAIGSKVPSKPAPEYISPLAER
jgi:hypothetical protein